MSQQVSLILIRHAQSEANSSKVISGALEVPLSPLGRQQAAQLQKILPALEIQEVITSAQERAKETASLALEPWYVSGRRETELLNERHWGVLEGVACHIYEEILEKKQISQKNFTPDEGESLDDLKSRVKDVASELRAINRNTAVFAHHSSLKALLCALLPAEFPEWDAFGIPNATPVMLTLEQSHFQLDSRSRKILFAPDALIAPLLLAE